MDLNSAIELIKPGITLTGQKTVWADLGCGTGLFTSALAKLLHDHSFIYAVDSNKSALEKLLPLANVEMKRIAADFTRNDLGISELDGILMANSLHFVKDKISFIEKAQQWLKKDGCFLLVEYNTDKANTWVPFPINFDSAKELFSTFGYTIHMTGSKASLYQRAGMYAAIIAK
jgi:ubiquinone/menaquinone biosynthesis C-methylase UbiE